MTDKLIERLSVWAKKTRRTYIMTGGEQNYEVDDFAKARDRIEALQTEKADMLEALEEVVSEYDEPDNGRSLRWAVDHARTVITKAKGASQ